jgi:hypothetical protein
MISPREQFTPANVIMKTLVLLALHVLVQTPSTAFAADKKGQALISGSTDGGDSWSIGLRMQPVLIDGKNKGRLFGRPIKVPAGQHAVGVNVHFDVKPKNPLFEPKPEYSDIFEFSMMFLSGHSYTTTGTQNGTRVEVWIVDQNTQEVVTDILEIEVFPCKKLFKRCPSPKVNWRAALY